MWKNLLGYIFFLATSVVLLVLSGSPYLFCVVILLFLIAIAMFLLVRKDAARLGISVRAQMGAQEGKENFFIVETHTKRKLRAARYLVLYVCETNEMSGQSQERELLLRLTGENMQYEVPLANSLCGEVRIVCKEAAVRDLLNLFRLRVQKFPEIRMIVYPRKVNLQVELSQMTIGAPKSEGMMQNRKGNDLSEIFDIREYVPGDDIRSIHWKLSSKTENLILREASDPSHYNVVLLPDLGQNLLTEENAEEIMNAAVAVGAAIGERLMEKRVSFCMALPAASGLKICEVKDRRAM